MGEDGAPGFDAGDPLQRLVDVGVGRVRGIGQGADDPRLDTVEGGERRFRQFHHVGRIGHRTEAVAHGLHHSMVLLEGRDPHADDPEGLSGGDLVGHQRRLIAYRRVVVQGREHIGEALADLSESGGVAVSVQRRVHGPVDRPQVVDAVHVVGVNMGVEHRVKPLDAGCQQLLAQVGRAIGQH